MLNSKVLSEVLSKNSDNRLCKRWFLMTPKGTLLAYTHPASIRELRRRAAEVALLWREHQDPPRDGVGDGKDSKLAMPGLVRTLTEESHTGNLIIRKIQPQLLLVLEGGVPPRRPNFESRTTVEGPGDEAYPPTNAQIANTSLSSSVSSAAASTNSSVSHGVLAMQRKKLDALAAAIAQSFELAGFKMPDEGDAKAF